MMELSEMDKAQDMIGGLGKKSMKRSATATEALEDEPGSPDANAKEIKAKQMMLEAGLESSPSHRNSLVSRDSDMTDFTTAEDDVSEISAVSSWDPVATFKTRSAMFGSVCTLLLWSICSMSLLTMSAWLYTGPVVDLDRQRYVESASQRVPAALAVVMSEALMVRDAVDYAVQRKFLFEPLDEVMARSVLEATFAQAYHLRAVDLAFTNRSDSLTLRRVTDMFGIDPGLKQGPAPVTMLVQTDAPNCKKILGPLGCSYAAEASEQPWFDVGLSLNGGIESAEASSTEAYFRWMDMPFFVEREVPPPTEPPPPKKAVVNWWDGGVSTYRADYVADGGTVEWETAYGLVFRSPFPGTRGFVSAIGRVTFELSSVRKTGRMVDKLLGPSDQGAIIFCNRNGRVIASLKQGLQAFTQVGVGRVRHRLAWELDFAWAAQLTEAHFQESGTVSLDIEGYRVVVSPLRGRGLEPFVVVLAGAKDEFYDVALVALGASAYLIGLAPIPVLVVIGVLYNGYQFIKRKLDERKSRRRTHPDDTFGASKSFNFTRSMSLGRLSQAMGHEDSTSTNAMNKMRRSYAAQMTATKSEKLIKQAEVRKSILG
jgi:hypothetical protein